jgi:iron complex transport system substrate-binding protein
MRVVSLLPSATELCYALGVEPVGVSHECDHPPAAREQPSVIESRIDATASSGAIDDQVQTAVTEGGVYDIDRERLAALDPDVVLSQGICEVCAVDDSRIRQAVTDLDLDAEVVTTDPHTLEDVFADLERLGERLDRQERAREVCTDLRERVDRVARATGERPRESRPSVAVLDWLDPVMVAGHWIPGMVETAGGTYDIADPGDPSRPREWEEIRSYDPDVLVAAPCGFDLDQTLDNVGDLTDRRGWSDLTAVETGRVYALDGHEYVNRPGPRLVDTLELLAGIIHPDAAASAVELPGETDAVARLSTPEGDAGVADRPASR